jgi:hypothetical protein
VTFAVKEKSAVAVEFEVKEEDVKTEETQMKESQLFHRESAADESCLETDWVLVLAAVVDVDLGDLGGAEDVGGAILAGPAEPYCAAALPATDAAGGVVLYMLNLPYYRPVRLGLGWASSSPEF